LFAIVLLWAVFAGFIFAAVHMANMWLFSREIFNDHIAYVYLPAFLRIANVLVMGTVWGCIATFMEAYF
jgi:hypothetical protein